MRKTIIILLMVVFSFSLVSAVLDVKEFDSKTGKYGEIIIKDWYGLSNKASYVLTDYDSSVIDVWGEGDYILYQDTVLFDGMTSFDLIGNKDVLKDITFYIWKTETTNKYEPIFKKQCNLDNKIFGNGTDIEFCDYILDSNNSIIVDSSHWELYKEGTTLKSGSGKWRFEGKRPINKNVDFILTAQGYDFNEWAWYNNSWTYHTNFTINSSVGVTLTNFPAMLSLNTSGLINSGKMNSSCKDLRVVDSTDTTEYVYEVENMTCNTNETIVYFSVPSLTSGNFTVKVYYGNPTSSSNENSTKLWTLANYSYVYHFAGSGMNSILSNTNLTANGTINYSYHQQYGFGANLSNTAPAKDFYATLFDPDSYNNGWSLMAITSGLNTRTAVYELPYYDYSGANGGGGLYQTDNTNLEIKWGDGNGASTGDSILGLYTSPLIKLYGSHNSTNNTNMIGNGTFQVKQTLPMGANSNLWYFPLRYDAQGKAWTIVTEIRIENTNTSLRNADWMWAELNQTWWEGSETTLSLLTATNPLPVTTYNSTNGVIDFVCNATDSTGIYNITLSINGTQYNITSGNGSSNLSTVFRNTLNNGVYSWYCTANNGGSSVNSSTSNFLVDSVKPKLQILNPITTLNYGASDFTLYLNWSINDTGYSPLSKCWYNFNGTNITVSACSDNYTIIYPTYPYQNITLFANDTIGNTNSTFSSWSYKIYKESENYPTSTLEGAIGTFRINLLTNGVDIAITNLTYNGVSQVASTSKNVNNFTITTSVTSAGVTGTTNISFYWNATRTDGFFYVFPTQNQTVSDLTITPSCTGALYTLYNFTIIEETNQTKLVNSTWNTTGRIDLTLYSLGRTNTLATVTSLQYSNPFSICLSSNLSTGGAFNLDAQIEYDADSYVNEFYNIQNATINSSSFPTNINLSLLNSSLSTTFKIYFKNNNVPVTDALIQIKRKYVDEGTFKIVEIPMTDSDGSVLAHLVLEDVIYSFVVIKNGVTLGTFNNYLVKCNNPLTDECVINLKSGTSTYQPTDFRSLDDFLYNLNYNKTSRLISLVYSIPSQTISTIGLNATLFNHPETSVCSSSLISPAGTVSCTVPSNYANSTIYIAITKDGLLIANSLYTLDAFNNRDRYAGVIIFLYIVVFMVLLGIGISDNPIITGGMIILGSVVLVGLNIMANSSWYGKGSAILWLIVAITLVLIKGGNRQ